MIRKQVPPTPKERLTDVQPVKPEGGTAGHVVRLPGGAMFFIPGEMPVREVPGSVQLPPDPPVGDESTPADS